MAATLKLTYLGTFWGWSGDLLYLTQPGDDGRGPEARIYVDSIGETWVDIRRVPEGGYFRTEQVDGFRANNGARSAELYLRMQGYTERRVAANAHNVRERIDA